MASKDALLALAANPFQEALVGSLLSGCAWLVGMLIGRWLSWPMPGVSEISTIVIAATVASFFGRHDVLTKVRRALAETQDATDAKGKAG